MIFKIYGNNSAITFFQNLMTMLNKIKFEILFLLLIFIKDLKTKIALVLFNILNSKI